MLIAAGLYFCFAGWRLKFIEKELELNENTVRCCLLCSDLCSSFELESLSSQLFETHALRNARPMVVSGNGLKVKTENDWKIKSVEELMQGTETIDGQSTKT